MRKQLYIGAFALLVAASQTACKKDFLETSPTTAVDAASALATVENAKAALNGIHRSIFARYDNQGEFGHGTVMLNVESLGDDYVFSGQSNGWFLTAYRWTMHRNANAGDNAFPYRFFYRVISNANTLINGVDGIPGASVADKNNLKGQALTYRAWSYFNLVQLYGKRFEAGGANTDLGVPLVLTNTTVPQARATVAQVYTQINSDLTAAEGLLTAGSATQADKSQLTQSTVRGLIARVALTQGDWDRAATKAAAARTGFSLMTAAQQLEGYNNYANPEWMWGSRQIDDQTEFFTAYLAYISYNFNSTNIRTNPKCINSALYNTMAPADVRRGLWRAAPTATNVVTPPGGNLANFMNQKFKAKDFANSVGDVPYMRVAEMWLIEAEARARNGQDALARTALYGLMQNRVPGSSESANSGAALITEIMNSRRVELWGEGFRFYDLKRLNEPLSRGANHNAALAVLVTMPAGDVSWQWLIPQAELNANPLATQNP
jgi:starch-binding outer membrane protein, SusD/RagB family